MEGQSFAMGRPRQETKQQRRERLRKLNQRKKQRGNLTGGVPKRPPWLILPSHVTKGFEFWIVTLKGNTFLSKKQSLMEDINRVKKEEPCPWTFHPSSREKHQKDYLEKADVVLGLLVENQRLRWIFKRFLNRARLSRFECLNEMDPITLEPMKQPISFASFAKRKRYTFEAQTFAKHLHKKLLHNDAQIPIPQYPKNPFTNEDFTLSQIIGLVEQCRTYGHSSWAMEAFVSCRYDLISFTAIHSKPLRLHAIRETMKHVTEWDAIDTLYDFIKSQHELHEECFYTTTYKWALHHAPYADRLVAWRKLCVKWYETDILIDDPSMKLLFLKEVESKTLPLCEKPSDLQALKLRKKKSLEQTDGSGSV